jgi:4-amino-4-deoxy-L-arabinose transferase-like glycosyltransferase
MISHLISNLRKQNTLLIVTAIFVLGVIVRAWGIGYGLPFAFIADEPNYLTITLKMLKSGDWNPHWWLYPSLMFYVMAFALWLFYGVANILGISFAPVDLPLPQVITMGVGRFSELGEILIARGLVVLFSALTILVVYALARRIHPNRWTAVIAALLFALSGTVLDHSQIVNPDIYALLFSLVSFFFAIRSLDDSRIRNYVFAGFLAGLAAASKYNAGIIALAIVIAHIIQFGWRGFLRRELYIAAIAALIGFIISTPFVLLDWANFINGVQWQVSSYSAEGHAGQEGDALRWYVDYLWNGETWVVIGAISSAVRALLTRSKKQWVLVIYSVGYFVFVSVFYTRNARTIMPILPYLYVLAAISLVDASEWLIQAKRWRREIVGACAAMMVLLAIVSPIQGAIAMNNRLTQPDAREPARLWIEQNVPPQSRIVVEAYAPFIDSQRFVVHGEYSLIDKPLEWYAQNGFEYVVASYGSYGRFYEDAARYPKEKNQYDTLFSSMQLIKQFPGGTEIRVYKTVSPIVPAHRQSTMFGVYAPWIEFLGYDGDAKLSRGENTLTLYWRAIDARREPLRLVVRWLNSAGNEIASSAELFNQMNSDGRGIAGVQRMPLKISLPADTEPGLYRAELSVSAEGIGTIPLLGLDNLPASDKLVFGSFKIAPLVSTADLQTTRPVNVKFGNAFALSAFSLSKSSNLWNVSLYWQSIAKTDTDYTMFVHVLDANGKVVAQIDAQPRGGTYPTSIWDVGEIIRDEYVLSLPKDLPAGEYKIEIGAYEYPSLMRVQIIDASGKNVGDHIVLDQWGISQ